MEAFVNPGANMSNSPMKEGAPKKLKEQSIRVRLQSVKSLYRAEESVPNAQWKINYIVCGR